MSRVDEQKGLRDFALSFNYLPSHLKEKIKFWIVGEPTIDKIDRDGNPIYEAESKNLYNWLKDYVQKPDIQGRIMLIPFQKDFISYLGSADIFILPSRNEMYSLAVIDAMLLSLPVIGTRAEGTQEQISDSYNGILVDISSPKQIAEAITKLVANPDMIRFISNNAILKAKKEHNWEKTIEDWIKLYSSFLRL
jgi:glycosyltransferase involved in cell wall biosynthesis